MSAFIVSDRHIDFLLQIAVRLTDGHRTLHWYHGDAHGILTTEREQLDRIGQMLLDENARSVDFRYRDRSDNGQPVAPYRFRPGTPKQWIHGSWQAQTLKAIACLRYQSCEHPGWESSEAFAFLHALESMTIDRIHGYQDAEWDINESQVAPGVVSLMDIVRAQESRRG